MRIIAVLLLLLGSAFASNYQLIPFDPFRNPTSLLTFNRVLTNTPEVILVVGGNSGAIAFYNIKTAIPTKLRDMTIGTDNIRFVDYLATSNYLAIGTSNFKMLTIINFSSLNSFVLGQTMTLVHTYPIESFTWNNAYQGMYPNIAIGTRVGILDEYQIVFPSSTPISSIPESARINRWFVGCPITFVAYTTSTTILAGCSTGSIYWFSSQTNPNSPISSLDLDLSPSEVTIALYSLSGNYLVCLLDLQVYIIALSSNTVVSDFSILPFITPISPNRAERSVRAISVITDTATNNPKTLIVRTTESIIQYDLTDIMSGAHDWWEHNLSVTDLTGNGRAILIKDNAMRLVTPDNDPYITVGTDQGVIDFVPCYNQAAKEVQVGDMTSVTCYPDSLTSPSTSSIIPVVSLEIHLRRPFTKVSGSFRLQSVGIMPGQDCPLGKTPITFWSDDQQSHWSLVGSAGSGGPISSCPPVLEQWRKSPIQTLSECKDACMRDLTCNLIVLDSDSTFCQLRACASPSTPPAPVSGIEMWVLSRPEDFSTPLYGGYVAFGTHDKVLYGGCQSPNGLIPSESSGTFATVNIPLAEFDNLQNVIRFQASQYSADARIRLSNLQLDLYSPYLTPVAMIAEPASMPGEFLLPVRDPRPGNANVPLALSPDGSVVITTNRHGYLGIYVLPLIQTLN